MRLAIRVVGLGLIAALALVGCASASSAPSASPSPSPTASPKPVAISIKSFAFNPATVEVAKGTTVTWTDTTGALALSTNYYYVVDATFANWTSPDSNVATVLTPDTNCHGGT